MSPQVIGVDEFFSPCGVDHSEQNDNNLTKIGSVVPKIRA